MQKEIGEIAASRDGRRAIANALRLLAEVADSRARRVPNRAQSRCGGGWLSATGKGEIMGRPYWIELEVGNEFFVAATALGVSPALVGYYPAQVGRE